MFINSTPVFDVEEADHRQGRARSSSAAASTRSIRRRQRSTACSRVRSPRSALTPAAFTSERQASRYVLTLTARIEFKDVKANKVLWSNPAMQFREEFDVDTDVARPSAFFGQDANALERVATEFARTRRQRDPRGVLTCYVPRATCHGQRATRELWLVIPKSSYVARGTLHVGRDAVVEPPSRAQADCTGQARSPLPDRW